MKKPHTPGPSPRPTAAPPAPGGGPYAVLVYPPNRDPWLLPLEAGREYNVGRDAGADIVLDYPWVSSFHVKLTGGSPPSVVELGSRNGTLLSGQPLPPGEVRPLRVGSILALGAVTLVVRRTEEVASSIWRTGAPLATPASLGPSPASLGPQPTRSGAPAAASAPASFITRDQKTRELFSLVQQVAESSVSVFIVGETGVGKELLARAIHENSPRSRRQLVTLNSAAVPEGLVESELFGYERGAFSGAVTSKPGLFEVAHGSTFFLDEIGELPTAVQPKLLRVLETGEVLRLGAVRPTRVDVRVVAATNRNIHSEIAAGAFRADLFYRLNGITITVPPLRERPDDIPELAQHFAELASPTARPELTRAALAALSAHGWPGNVRELKSVVERAVLLARGGVIDVQHLLIDVPFVSQAPRAEPMLSDSHSLFTDEEVPTELVRAELDRRERKRIEDALQRTGGNQKDAAKLLGISRRTLINRMDRYALTRPRKRPSGADDG